MFNTTKSENITFRSLCKQILQAHKSIRFAGVANKFGTKIASEYRKDLVPLLTENQLELSTIESAIRMNTRMWDKDVESKLGRPIYSCTLYEKIKRVTFLLDNEDYPILIVSLDIGGGGGGGGGASAIQESVVLNKILSIVNEQNISPRLNGGLAL
jgi:hypothetical protein